MLHTSNPIIKHKVGLLRMQINNTTIMELPPWMRCATEAMRNIKALLSGFAPAIPHIGFFTQKNWCQIAIAFLLIAVRVEFRRKITSNYDVKDVKNCGQKCLLR